MNSEIRFTIFQNGRGENLRVCNLLTPGINGEVGRNKPRSNLNLYSVPRIGEYVAIDGYCYLVINVAYALDDGSIEVFVSEGILEVDMNSNIALSSR
jgi:hypothetical protein